MLDIITISSINYSMCSLVSTRLHSFSRSEKSSVQFNSVAQSCPTLCDPMDCKTQASLSITISQSLLKLMSIESVMPSNHLILCHPLLLLPSLFPSIRVFSNESALCIRWPKYQSFSFNISPSNKLSGLISFRMDWLDLLAVQGTLKSLLQHHSSKASILRRSAFFIVQLSRPYMTTGEWVAILLQGIFPTQGLNPGLPHCRQMLYYLSHQGTRYLYINSIIFNIIIFFCV